MEGLKRQREKVMAPVAPMGLYSLQKHHQEATPAFNIYVSNLVIYSYMNILHEIFCIFAFSNFMELSFCHGSLLVVLFRPLFDLKFFSGPSTYIV